MANQFIGCPVPPFANAALPGLSNGPPVSEPTTCVMWSWPRLGRTSPHHPRGRSHRLALASSWLGRQSLRPGPEFTSERATTGNGPRPATQPQLLLLDEAIAGLNPTEVRQIMDLIRAVQGTGVTIFLIEHVMKAILGLSDTKSLCQPRRENRRGPAAGCGQRSSGHRRLSGPETPGVGDIFVVIHVQHLAVFYGMQALWDVSLQVNEGEIVTCWACGAGKTTTPACYRPVRPRQQHHVSGPGAAPRRPRASSKPVSFTLPRAASCSPHDRAGES